MTLVFIIWLVTSVLPAVTGVCIFVGIAYTLVILFSLIHNWIEKDGDREEKGYIELVHKKRYVFLPVVCFFLAGLIPDKETSYVMLAAYGVESIASNDKVQELGGKSLEVLEKAMDSYLKETTSSEEK